MSTATDRRALVERLLTAWDRVPQQRLGQLLDNACRGRATAGATETFHVADSALIEFVEVFAAAHGKQADRRAIVSSDPWLQRGTAGHEPGTVTWSEHLQAWKQYARDGHRSLSAERINERGGFGYSEITKLLGHAP